MSNLRAQSTLKRKNVKGLALNAPPAQKTPSPSAGDAQIPGAIGNDERQDTLEIGVEFDLDLRNEDLIVLKELGHGNGGTVSKVIHAATKVVMARKIIHVDAKKEVRKQILRELHVMHDCNSPHIVSWYGAFLNDLGDVVMCMEYMDCSSLDRISKDFGPVRVDVLGKIAEAVLGGLAYLYNVHRIMHRDIKPSNVLVNSQGSIKLCDFGVSGELANSSIADTFVGTSTYMAPERIEGGQYTVKSDVWSVGLTLMELAIGRFPFDNSDNDAGERANGGPMAILDLLQSIVHEPSPKLPQSDAFPPILEEMIAKCLLKNPDERPTPQQLYEKDAFLQAAKRTNVDLEGWAVSLLERNNRKSHLPPQLSPSTQALLNSKEEEQSKKSPKQAGTSIAKEPALSKTPSASSANKVSSPYAELPAPPSENRGSPLSGGAGGIGGAPRWGSVSTGTAAKQQVNYQPPSGYSYHPGLPPRTSSSPAVREGSPRMMNENKPTPLPPQEGMRPGSSTSGTPNGSIRAPITTTLPVRPAPPPTGPVPYLPPQPSAGSPGVGLRPDSNRKGSVAASSSSAGTDSVSSSSSRRFGSMSNASGQPTAGQTYAEYGSPFRQGLNGR